MTGLPQDLDDAGRAYVEAMPKGEIVAFPISPLDTIGLPVCRALGNGLGRFGPLCRAGGKRACCSGFMPGC